MTKFISNFLRLALIGITGLIVFISIMIGLGTIPAMIQLYPGNDWLFYTIITGIYVSVVFFAYGMFQAFMLLRNFELHETFTAKTGLRLAKIKYAALAIGGLYVLGSPFAYIWAQIEDAPGLLLIELIFGGLSFAVAAFAKLSQNIVAEGTITKKQTNNLEAN